MTDLPAIRSALADHAMIPDSMFDAVFPLELRARSTVHWTPVDVALRAAQLLALRLPAPDTFRVLDVGAGVGKTCLIGALATSFEWWGIERDPDQVAAARHAACLLGIGSPERFMLGDAWSVDWSQFDAFYFFNPFHEAPDESRGSPFVRYARVKTQIDRAKHLLANARAGTRVVTYHGYGDELPDRYELVVREEAHTDALELWVLTSASSNRATP